MKTVVREVFHKGSSTVVEWFDDKGVLRRVTVPSDIIVKEANGDLTVEDVEEGQPYGVAWETLMRTQFGPMKIAELLRKNGIWTLEDYALRTRDVTAAFNEACSANLQHFKEAVINFRDHKGESN